MQITKDGIALAYDDAGCGGTPMVMVHGWATDRTLFRFLFERQRLSRRVVSVDLRGFGQSESPQQEYTIQGYSDDLAFLVRHLNLRKPVVIGHSMGGMIALDYASRYLDQISAAVILEGMVIASELVRAGLSSMLNEVRKGNYREFVTGLMTYLCGPHFDPVERARLVDLSTSCPQHVLVSALESIISFDSIAAASRVVCPILYIGTNIVYADLPRFRELCTQLVTGQVVACGHYFPLEVPDMVDSMVARFLSTNLTQVVG